MFEWLKRKRTSPVVPERPPVEDAVLGALVWDNHEEAWVAHVPHSGNQFRILLAGRDGPDARLVLHAREIFTAPDKLITEVKPIIQSAASEIPEAAGEILALKIQAVALLWPDRPDDGMIYFDGPGTDERSWRCDYIARRAQELGFDD